MKNGEGYRRSKLLRVDPKRKVIEFGSFLAALPDAEAAAAETGICTREVAPFALVVG